MNLIKTSLFYLAGFFVAGCGFFPAYASDKSKNILDKAAENPAVESGQIQAVSLELKQFIKMVNKNNFDIISSKYDLEIASEQLRKAWAVFEPDFVVSFTHKDGETQNVAEDYFDRLNRPVFDEITNQSETKIEGLLPTGTKISLGWTLNVAKNYLVEQKYSGETTEYSHSFGVDITQPLLKNAWFTGTMSNIKITEVEKDISYLRYIKKINDLVTGSVNIYWKLYYSLKQYRIFMDSVRIAENVLTNVREGVLVGKMAESDLYDAKSGLMLRRSLANDAKQKVEKTQNFILTLLGESIQENKKKYVAVDSLPHGFSPEKLNYQEIMNNALEKNPDYREALRMVEKIDLQINYAKNQGLPQVDLKGGYSLNGVGINSSDAVDTAFSHKYNTWYAGIQIHIPFGGGIDTRSELRAVELKKKQALLKVNYLKTQIQNQVNTAVKSVASLRDQLQDYAKAVEMKKNRLNGDIELLKAGKISSQQVLKSEEALNKSRKQKLIVEIELENACVYLKNIQGSLLKTYGVRVESMDEMDDFKVGLDWVLNH